MRSTANEPWFTAAQFEAAGRSEANGQAGTQRWIAHAKQMGTNLTACGQNAFTWSKLWHVPFDLATAARCQACVEVVASHVVHRDRVR